MSLNSPVNLAHTLEMHGRQRFAFGKNWESFLLNLTEQRVKIAGRFGDQA